MAKHIVAPSLAYLVLLSLIYTGFTMSVLAQAPALATNEQLKTWCISKPSVDSETLRWNIDYACVQIGDCSIIDRGGACYHPDTDVNHASVVMNLYYQRNGRNFWNCYFNNTGLTTLQDPSYGNCTFA